MNLLALRSLIANALRIDKRTVVMPCADILDVQHVNQNRAEGETGWALRVKVADGVGGTRAFRIDFTEEG